MPVTGKHSIRSLGARPTEAAENLKSVCDGGAIETVVEKARHRGRRAGVRRAAQAL